MGSSFPGLVGPRAARVIPCAASAEGEVIVAKYLVINEPESRWELPADTDLDALRESIERGTTSKAITFVTVLLGGVETQLMLRHDGWAACAVVDTKGFV